MIRRVFIPTSHMQVALSGFHFTHCQRRSWKGAILALHTWCQRQQHPPSLFPLYKAPLEAQTLSGHLGHPQALMSLPGPLGFPLTAHSLRPHLSPTQVFTKWPRIPPWPSCLPIESKVSPRLSPDLPWDQPCPQGGAWCPGAGTGLAARPCTAVPGGCLHGACPY